ncbi:MAG: DUF1015 domain-containing protein [Terriglobales bacterium]
MAMIAPFRAWRYDPARVRVADVLTQPYDKITPQMQERYLAASPWNLVRIELGRGQPGDNDSENVYTRAAGCFRDWRQQGVLLQDTEPSLYVYSQRFPAPGGGPERQRSGIIALGRIEDYDAHVIFRHEQTHSGPKADRLNLLRATQAHFGQLFLLYSDPEHALESRLKPAGEPDTQMLDEFGVCHRLWKISDPGAIEFARRSLADKKLLIADGHHRYETALAYRNQRRAESNGLPPDAPSEMVMMTLVNMDTEDLVILPTHRVLSGLQDFHTEDLLCGAREWFQVSGAGALDATQAIALLAAAGKEGSALVAVTSGGTFLLRARPEVVDRALHQLSPRQRGLDVVLLHKLLVEQVLGVSEAAVRELRNIAYLREAGEAIQRVREGAEVAFLMNPVTIPQLRHVAFAGEVMPQKSTDFYPKLLSGIAIYALD